MNGITKQDVRRLRAAFLAHGPGLDDLTHAAAAGLLPQAERLRQAGEWLAARPGELEVRLIARATRRTPESVVRRFPPLSLALLAAVTHTTLPALFGPVPPRTAPADPLSLARLLSTPPSRN